MLIGVRAGNLKLISVCARLEVHALRVSEPVGMVLVYTAASAQSNHGRLCFLSSIGRVSPGQTAKLLQSHAFRTYVELQGIVRHDF